LRTQESNVKLLLLYAISCFKGSMICFKSVHAAVLQPRRLAAWLESAVAGRVEKCAILVELVQVLVKPQPPLIEGCPPPEAAGLVSAAQWREGALQLRREVSNWVWPWLWLWLW
jgi:hypothetical protein